MGLCLKVIDVGKLLLLGSLAWMTGATEPLKSPEGALMCPAEGAHYSYIYGHTQGPGEWSKISACCDGTRQSPRNIITSYPFTVCNGRSFPQLAYSGPSIVSGNLYNTGHDPNLAISGSTTVYLDKAPHTNGLYALSNIHIHFRSMNGHGSEHAIDFKYYDAELHMVHYKAEYGSVAAAVMHPDGLAVIGLMLEITDEEPNPEIVKLTDAIQAVNGIGIEGAVPHEVDLSQLLPTSQDFYTYAGSLTTPPCSESVRWIVMRETLPITQDQLDILTNMESSDGGLISDHSNDRPVQTGDTQVETNFDCRLPFAQNKLG